jgi:zinc transport system substrate-binding protein
VRGRARGQWRAVVGTLMAAALAAVVPTACGAVGDERPPADVVAAFFPLAAAARAVGGPGVSVEDLTPPGVEPHDLELTTTEMDAILDARLLVLMGEGFQPAVERGAEQRSGPTLEVLHGRPAGDDPHVWLDPVLMQRVTARVASAMARAVPRARAGMDDRVARVDAALAALDAEYRRGLRRCDRRVIVTAHAAFGHLARRYGLQQQAIAGISPEQEPDPRRLAELGDLVRRRNVTTVFTERLVSPRVADTLARDAGVTTAVLDPIESPAGRPTFAGYLRAMRSNLGVLRAALGCR